MFLRPAILLATGLLLAIAFGMHVEIEHPAAGPIAVAAAPAVTQHDPRIEPHPDGGRAPPLVAPLSPPTLTDIRRRLFDAPDVLAAVEQARAHGTADEKELAVDVLRECYGHDGTPPPPEVAQLNLPPPSAERRAALGELERRCAGVKALSWPQRKALTAELSAAAAAAASGSVVQRLRAIDERERLAGDTRWTPTEATAIAEALFSGDALLRREGFYVLASAIDRNAPGGVERSEALWLAMGEEVVNPRLSEFERLQFCAHLGNCGGASNINMSIGDEVGEVAGNQQAHRELQRLAALYGAAFAQGLSPRDILAIR